MKSKQILLILTVQLLAEGDAPEVRGLFQDSELVVRGRVLDAEPAPGGQWHRLSVDEVIWMRPGRTGEEAVGPVLRLFTHDPGVCPGADLTAGEDFIIGATLLPPPGTENVHPFLSRLLESFRPYRAGERPAVAAPDGVLAVVDHLALAEAAVRMVRVLRDPAQSPSRRREFLLEMAGGEEPLLREEALRQLAALGPALEAEEVARALDLFAAEVDGPAHPRVLEAHLGLLGSAGLPGAGPILIRLLEAAPRENLALQAGAALAELGGPEDFRALASRFGASPPEVQVRALHALFLKGGAEHAPVFMAALKSPHPAVRQAAREGLAMARSSSAGDHLRAALEAARRRLEVRSRPAPEEGRP